MMKLFWALIALLACVALATWALPHERGPEAIERASAPDRAERSLEGPVIEASVMEAQVNEAPAIEAPAASRADDVAPGHRPGHQPAPAPPAPWEDESAAPPPIPPVTGEGTKEQPYRISWELLASARRTYRPKEGLTEIPEEIKCLDGKYVLIEGWVMYSWSGDEVEDLLLMQYMWDGCCIGIPPSPYSGLEATLAESIPRAELLDMKTAAMIGRLRVDPYLYENWLIALYVIDDAMLEPQT